MIPNLEMNHEEEKGLIYKLAEIIKMLILVNEVVSGTTNKSEIN